MNSAKNRAKKARLHPVCVPFPTLPFAVQLAIPLLYFTRKVAHKHKTRITRHA